MFVETDGSKIKLDLGDGVWHAEETDNIYFGNMLNIQDVFT